MSSPIQHPSPVGAVSPDGIDVFVSAPMAGFRSEGKYRAFRAEVSAVVQCLEEVGLSTFFAGRNVESPDAFDEPDESAVRDLDALERSKYFLLLYPERIVSSVLVEAGYAIARGIKAVYFVRDTKHLPFLLRHLDRVQPIKIYEYETTERICSLVRRHGAKLFEPWRESRPPASPTVEAPRPASPFHPSGVIGPYTLVGKLGEGGFGSVWRAERRTALATTSFALKVPHAGGTDPALVEAIRREAGVWVQASGHPNVLPVIEAECYDGQLVIVSPFAAEGPLDRWLRVNGGAAPSVADAVGMARGILAGLAHLHGRRLIHRDLKPANVLLEAGIPRIADFGLARVLTADQTYSVGGTPAYMAPEAWGGDRSEAGDLWALGVILYEMLAGRRPFPQADVNDLRLAVSADPHPPLPPSVAPAALAELVSLLLQKDPARRPSGAGEVLAKLGSL